MHSVLISAARTLDAVLVVSDQFSEPQRRIGLGIVVNMSILAGVGTYSHNSGKHICVVFCISSIYLNIFFFSSFELTPR